MKTYVPKTKESEKINALSEILQHYYNKEMLLAFFRVFLRQFILDNEAVCRQYGVPVTGIRKPQPSKSELTDSLKAIFGNRELFRNMLAALPEPLPAVFYRIIWEGGQDHESLEKEFNIKAVYTNKELAMHYPNALAEINPYFCLFRDDASSRAYIIWTSVQQKTFKDESSYHHFFYFPPPLASHLKSFTEKPTGYHLQPAPAPEATVFSDPESLFSELPVALSYLQQGKLAVSDAGTVLPGSYNKMRKYCGIKEFYPEDADKNLANIRTRFLIEMLRILSRKKDFTYEDSVDFIKQGFKLYQEGRLSSLATLFHLKGLRRANDTKQVNRVLFALLRELPLLQWVKAENLLQYAIYRDLSLDPVPRWEAANYLYFESEGRYGKDKNYITLPNSQTLLTEPLLRGSFFLFATFGLVDIAYGPPQNARALAYGKPYISVFDGLQAVRLTPLGAYVCGLSQEYAAPVTQDENVVLDDQHLFITYTGENRSLYSILEKVGRKTSNNLYKVDYESLLGDCFSHKEIKAKINIFKQLLSANPPAIWQAFFADIQEKSFTMSSLNEEYQVFQLPDNKELIRLIATDDFLKKNCLKAEMFHILIARPNVSKVKNYLKKYGFLIDFK